MRTGSRRAPAIVLFVCLAMGAALRGSVLRAAPAIPESWDIVADDFEGGSLAEWERFGSVRIATGGGRHGSSGLDVVVDGTESSIRQSQVAKAAEGYLRFWFHPNGVRIPEPTPNDWPPGASLAVAEVLCSRSWWPPLVALYVRRPPGEGYQGYLAWPADSTGRRHYDFENAFDLVDGWQEITIGYRIDEWVAVWVDGTLVRYDDATVVHPDPYGDVAYMGKIRENTQGSLPSGSIRFDDVAFRVPRVNELWVDANYGRDDNDGRTAIAPFRTIQRAADEAGPGTAVHILPGVYRETVRPVLSGTADEPVLYRSEGGPGAATIRGSEPSRALAWSRLASDTIGLPPGVGASSIWWADLSSWALEAPPRFVVLGLSERLPLAREPDWQVRTDWKTAELWWSADGGSAPAACDPVTSADHNCDLPQRSMTQLTDRTDDSEPAGVEPGNLTTLANLEGATLVAIDTLQGHYNYRRSIVRHDVAAGTITVDRICEHDTGSSNPGLGWGTKYFVENHPSLLDSPGEWWYDAAAKRLYMWPPMDASPAALDVEISRRAIGVSLKNRSHVSLDGLGVEVVDDRAVSQENWSKERSFGNELRNLRLRYANYGVYVVQSVEAGEPASKVTDGFVLEDSEVGYMDSQGMYLLDWWDDGAAADSFLRSGISNTAIRRNEFHHLGFRTDGDNAIGLSFGFANKLRFEDNHVHHVAHNGVQFSRSVIQSPKTHGFDPDEIKTGEILINDNLLEKACQLTTDCGPLKFWGSPPDGHVFRDVLVTGNVFRDTYAWSSVSAKRERYAGGPGSEVRGMGALGLYVDFASGLHAYRNISYNVAYAGFSLGGNWRDGAIVYVNNVAANSLYGMVLGGEQYDDHGSVDTRILDNILVGNEAFGVSVSHARRRTENMVVDHNLYYANGWRPYEDGGIWHGGAMVVREDGAWKPYATLGELQAATPWEPNGVAGDPAFADYDADDHELTDGSWPDFHLTEASGRAIDRGVTGLPPSLSALLARFGIPDVRHGPAFDIGRYETGASTVGRLYLPTLDRR